MTPTTRHALMLLGAGCIALAGCSSDDSSPGTPDAAADGAVKDAAADHAVDATTGDDDAGQDATTGDDAGHDATTDANGGDDGGADAADTSTADTSIPDTGPDVNGPAEAGTVPTDAIAIWSFDEATGTVALDSSGNGHHASLQGGATFAPGKHGTGLYPNGAGWAEISAAAVVVDAGAPDADTDADTDAGVDAGVDAGGDGGSDAATDAADGGAATAFVPLNFDTTKSFSVVCWVKVYSKGAGQWQSIFSRDATNLSAFTLKLRGDSPAPAQGELFDFDFPGEDSTSTSIYTVASSSTSPSTSPSDNSADVWYHLAAVFDANAADPDSGTTLAPVRLYVNAVLEGSASPGGNAILAGTGKTFIGDSLFGGRGASFNGVIDDVQLYGRALNPGEVSALFYSTK